MWIVNITIVHILLLGSIFVIYFRSPVIKNLQPKKSLIEQGITPPAKRVVLFVTDGLRAESFYHNEFTDLPDLHKLIRETGIVGISNTRVPTESRPGHIALLAGLYEDPSAVTRGWKENPIEFDTVFNRSAYTYGWGAHDIMGIFSRLSTTSAQRQMVFSAYTDYLDFTGRKESWQLDQWVFERVPKLLARKAEYLQDQQQGIFFLHLLGLDTAGHVHKPGSKLFKENLLYTQKKIVEMYEIFEKSFPDQKTAYILTSDHGMTNTGSHGDGSTYETVTPFFIWGAGIQHKPYNLSSLPMLEQAQFTPIISALLGSAPPMNNFGIMPTDLLNVTSEYLAKFMHNNAQQLMAQFNALKDEHEQGYFSAYLREYTLLDKQRLSLYYTAIQNYYTHEQWDMAIAESRDIMQHALKGIEYYHTYYRTVLLASTTLTFVGCIFYALQLLSTAQAKTNSKLHAIEALSLTLFLSVCCWLQNVDIYTTLYVILPVPVFWLSFKNSSNFHLPPLPDKLHLLVLIICAELIVYTFFQNTLISMCFFIYACFFSLRQIQRQLYIWLPIAIALTVWPFLSSPVGTKNTKLLLLGLLAIVLRAFIVKLKLPWQHLLVYLLAIGNYLGCIFMHSNLLKIYSINYLMNWAFIVYAFGSLLVHKKLQLQQRVELIVLNLSLLYALLATSYELIFVVLLTSELIISLSSANEQTLNYSQHKNIQTFQIALGILLYTFLSFFGTGNIASISSFDTNIARCFVGKFAPFVIMFLVILKLSLPILLTFCIIYGHCSLARQQERQIFLWLLIMCDIIGLNFLFLVRNEGSWREIGTSISHFVIMEVTTLVLIVITIVAKCLLQIDFKDFFLFKNK